MPTESGAGPHDSVPWSVDVLLDILDHVPSSIGVWDAQLRNDYLNRAAYDSLALDGDAQGRALVDVVGRRAYALAIEWIRRAQAGERQRFMRVVRRADGREEHYDVEYLPFPSADRQPTSLLAIGFDVSAQVTADILRQDIAPYLAAVNERELVAGELEDTLAAALDSLVRDLTAAADRTPSFAPALAQAATLTEVALEQLHALLHNRSTSEQIVPFAAAAQQLVDEATVTLGFPPTFEMRGRVEGIVPLLAVDVLAALGEALLNVARHAAATAVVAAVTVTSSQVSVTVADDGRGIGSAPAGGGMSNLQARAARLDGTCTWESTGATGTLFEWRIPLAAPTAGTAQGGPVGPAVLDLPLARQAGEVLARSTGLDAGRLLQVLDALTSVVVVWNDEQRLEFVNAAGVAWFDVDGRDDVLGRTMAELLPPGAYYSTRPFVRAVLDGEPQQFERSGVDDGVATNIRVIYTPRFDDGRVSGFVAQIFDISDRMRAQQDAQRSMQQMMALEERRRVAEDLHDFVIQHLFAAGLQLEGALRVAKDDPLGDGAGVRLLHDAIGRVDVAIAGLRDSIDALRADPLYPTSSPG